MEVGGAPQAVARAGAQGQTVYARGEAGGAKLRCVDGHHAAGREACEGSGCPRGGVVLVPVVFHLGDAGAIHQHVLPIDGAPQAVQSASLGADAEAVEAVADAGGRKLRVVDGDGGALREGGVLHALAEGGHRVVEVFHLHHAGAIHQHVLPIDGAPQAVQSASLGADAEAVEAVADAGGRKLRVVDGDGGALREGGVLHALAEGGHRVVEVFHLHHAGAIHQHVLPIDGAPQAVQSAGLGADAEAVEAVADAGGRELCVVDGDGGALGEGCVLGALAVGGDGVVEVFHLHHASAVHQHLLPVGRTPHAGAAGTRAETQTVVAVADASGGELRVVDSHRALRGRGGIGAALAKARVDVIEVFYAAHLLPHHYAVQSYRRPHSMTGAAADAQRVDACAEAGGADGGVDIDLVGSRPARDGRAVAAARVSVPVILHATHRLAHRCGRQGHQQQASR